jgi:hypothetical protein
VKYIEKTDELELSTGRRVPLSMGTVGLTVRGDGDQRVYTGRSGTLLFDVGGVGLSWVRGEGDPLTPVERQEIGDHMVALWTRWRGRQVTTVGDATPLSADPMSGMLEAPK